MNYGLVLTARTRADILRNAEWWAENHSPDQAIAWFDLIYEQLESLRMMPERFPLAPQNGSVEVEIREMPLGVGSRPSYRAVFTIKPLASLRYQPKWKRKHPRAEKSSCGC